MNDRLSLDDNESFEEKRDRAKSLFLESLYKADHQLRGCAHNQKCFNELMQIREEIIEYVRTIAMLFYSHFNEEEIESKPVLH